MQVRPASPADCASLADLAAHCPMEGVLTVATVPGPRPLAWEAFVAPRVSWVAEDAGRVVGSMTLGERWSRLDGRLMRWGYFGELRVLREFRRRGVAIALIKAGLVAERAAQSRYSALVTLGGNRAMEAVLGRQPVVPRALPAARMRLTQWLALRVPRPGLGARPARPDDLPDLFRLLDRHWAARSFAPALRVDEFAAAWDCDPSLTLADAVVVERGGAIVGVGALWDQRQLRQEIVLRYGFPLGAAALALRRYAAWTGGPAVPEVGAPIPLAFLRFFAAVDLDAARAVRDAVLARARERQLLVVMLGLDARDPLADVRRGRLRIDLPSILWVGDPRRPTPDLGPLGGAPAYVDYSLV